MTVAIYARVSTEDQSVESQLHDLREYCGFRNWHHVEEYVDVISGATRSRPELDRLMHDAGLGKIYTVLVWKFDRFARSALQLIQALETFRQLEIDFVSLKDAIDTTTPIGKAMFTMIAAIAELERETIRERVRAGIRAALARGQAFGRPKLERQWASLAEMVNVKGKSIRQIARELNCSPATVLNRLKEQKKHGLDKTATNGS